jgi:small subunit ribosomal protein S9
MSEDPRDELPQDAEPETSGEEPVAGAPGEPGEATPSETAPEEPSEAVGPEIEGAEELVASAAESQEPESEDTAAAEPAPEEPGAEDAAAGEAPRERRPKRERRDRGESSEEVIPGMHLEPDLVLEDQPREESEFGQYAEEEDVAARGEETEEPSEEPPTEPEVVARTPLDLAADARYRATGKRKSAIARVILKPGEGTYSVNGRHLDEYFPRVKLQRLARQPLEATGNQSRMDVVARIHGGGVSSQASALRHGVARALVEADPALRTELKRRGYLTRDPRVKERKKAGLKKARKRPQFSKR